MAADSPDDPWDTRDATALRGIRVVVAPLPRNEARTAPLPGCSVMRYGASQEIIRAFFLGAADYLAAPWTFVELISRANRLVAVQGILEDSFQRQNIVLRRGETELWSLLQQHEGRVVDRFAIAQALSLPAGASSRAVDMAVSRLRRALGALAWRVETVPRRGYRLRSAGKPMPRQSIQE